jgi:hypothetical protein
LGKLGLDDSALQFCFTQALASNTPLWLAPFSLGS